MKEIHVDGSGWNGKVSGYAIVFIDDPDRFPIVIKNTENKTNNQREYEAIIEGIKHAEHGDLIVTDSQLCFNQIYGRWKVSDMDLFPLCDEARKLLTEKKCKIKWCERKQNKAGKLL